MRIRYVTPGLFSGYATLSPHVIVSTSIQAGRLLLGKSAQTLPV